MNNLLNGSFPAALLYRLVIITATYALFLPFFGPALDHHFAERQPHHAHLYLSGDGAHHVHFYEQEHAHSHRGGNVPSDNPPPQDADIIYLTSNEGLGQSANYLAAIAPQIEVVYLALGGDPFLPGYCSQAFCPPEAFVPPPEKPPRG